jgi:hypothetical protein
MGSAFKKAKKIWLVATIFIVLVVVGPFVAEMFVQPEFEKTNVPPGHVADLPEAVYAGTEPEKYIVLGEDTSARAAAC